MKPFAPLGVQPKAQGLPMHPALTCEVRFHIFLFLLLLNVF